MHTHTHMHTPSHTHTLCAITSLYCCCTLTEQNQLIVELQPLSEKHFLSVQGHPEPALDHTLVHHGNHVVLEAQNAVVYVQLC